VSSDIAGLESGQARYGLLTNERGTIVDDVIVYRLAPQRYMVVVNAANIDKDAAHVRRHLPSDVRFFDGSAMTALIAPQGPRAARILSRVADMNVDDVMPFGVAETKVAGKTATIARTGYTGEDGFEVFLRNEFASAVWDALLDAGTADGMLPIGLVVEGGVARHGYPVTSGGREVGIVTSGTYGPTVEKNIALAYVPVALAKVGTALAVRIREKDVPATVVKTPFYSRVKK